MRKYENVDIIAALGAVMEINTEHYKSDFQYDIKMFRKAAVEPDGNNNHLVWFSRPSGTECFHERSVHIKETSAFNTCQHHAASKDNILAYAVEVTGMENGKPMGNLYSLDFRRYAAQLQKDAHTPTDVTLLLADNTQKRISFNEYMNTGNMELAQKYGKIARLRFEVENEGALQSGLKSERDKRQAHKPTPFKLKNSNHKPSINEQLKRNKEISDSSNRKQAQATVGVERYNKTPVI